MASLTVVGSVNLDMVVRLPHLPNEGETVTNGEFTTHPGGKGGNQALAARRLGSDVDLVAAVGDDSQASTALGLLRQAGVTLERCWAYEGVPTGAALIFVDGTGENMIGVAPGANRLLTPDTLELGPTENILAQLEIPLETVTAASQTRGYFALNAAPARSLPAEILARADLVVVNEVERDFYQDALDQVPGMVVVTMGAAGAVAFRQGRPLAQASPPPVEVVDTVGAGDAFAAALVVALLDGLPVKRALERACVAGALAATRPGAQPSMPTAAEVDAIIT